MKVFICTYGRAGKQTTWNNLPSDIKARTKLVVQHREKELYPDYPTLVLPPGVEGIGPTRQWLVSQPDHSFIIMLDDDLVFAKRRIDDPNKFTSLPPGDNRISELFSLMRDLYEEGRVHIGVAGREGANRKHDPYLVSTRMMRVLGYDCATLRTLGIQFDRLPVMEDFDVTLQLLRLGWENIVINSYVQNQNGSGLEGGCASYRTPEVQEFAAEGLAALHPDFVTVVTKKTKTAWGGQERKDVRVQWKKAYDSYKSSTDIDLLD